MTLVESLAVIDSNNRSVHLWDHVAVVGHDDVGLLVDGVLLDQLDLADI